MNRLDDIGGEANGSLGDAADEIGFVDEIEPFGNRILQTREGRFAGDGPRDDASDGLRVAIDFRGKLVDGNGSLEPFGEDLFDFKGFREAASVDSFSRGIIFDLS